MNGMKGIDQSTLSVQIKSLMIYEFLNEYTRLEQIIREIFEQNISSLPAKVIQQLYFYNGGRIGTYIDFEEDTIKLNAAQFKKNDRFKDLSINQIIKLFKKESCIRAFDFEIQSIQRVTTTYSFYDCVTRLLNMRNVLAHEMVNLQFKDKHLIELLTIDQLGAQNFKILQNFDVGKMDNMTQYIASNLVYMLKLISVLEYSAV